MYSSSVQINEMETAVFLLYLLLFRAGLLNMGAGYKVGPRTCFRKPVSLSPSSSTPFAI